MAKHHDNKRIYQYKRVKNYLQKDKELSISSYSQSSFYGDQSQQNYNNKEQKPQDLNNILNQLNIKDKTKGKKKRKKKKSPKKIKNCIIKPSNMCQAKISDTSDSAILKKICQQIDQKIISNKRQKQWSTTVGNYYLNPNNFERFLKRQETKARLKKIVKQRNHQRRIWRKIIQKQNPYNDKYMMFDQKIILRRKKEKTNSNKHNLNKYQIIDKDTKKQIKVLSKEIMKYQQKRRNLKISNSPYQENIYIFNPQKICTQINSHRQTNFRIKQKNEKYSFRPFSSNLINRKCHKQQDYKQEKNQQQKFIRSASAHNNIKICKSDIHNLKQESKFQYKNIKKRLSSFQEFLIRQNLSKKQKLNTQKVKVKNGVIYQQKNKKNYGQNLLKCKSTTIVKHSNSLFKPKQNSKNKIMQQMFNRKLTIYQRQNKLK